MKKIVLATLVLATLVLSQSLVCSQEHPNCCSSPDCCSSTEYIMQFLAKSGTKWKGAQGWLQDLKNNKTIKTNYLTTHDHFEKLEYSGFSVTAHDFAQKFAEVPVDTVKARFEISLVSDDVEIISDIEDIEVKRMSESIIIKKRSVDIIDSFSQCRHSLETEEYREDNRLLAITRVSCNTKIPFEVFLKEIHKYKFDH